MASHGFGPTFLPLRMVTQTLNRNGRIEKARMKAPIEDSMLRKLQPGVGRVDGDAPLHAAQPEVVLGEERQVEADEHEDERQLAQPLVQLLAGELGEPVVDAREGGEHRPAEEHVVEVGHHEIGVVQLEVQRGLGQHDAGEPAEQEADQESEREEHG